MIVKNSSQNQIKNSGANSNPHRVQFPEIPVPESREFDKNFHFQEKVTNIVFLEKLSKYLRNIDRKFLNSRKKSNNVDFRTKIVQGDP